MIHIEERQVYQIVYVNVTSKRGRDIKLFVRMLHRRDPGISNCLCKCYIEEGKDIKLFVRLLHRRGTAEISNCLRECYIEERQRYQIVYVND
jgi:hypothetical protein